MKTPLPPPLPPALLSLPASLCSLDLSFCFLDFWLWPLDRHGANLFNYVVEEPSVSSPPICCFKFRPTLADSLYGGIKLQALLLGFDISRILVPLFGDTYPADVNIESALSGHAPKRLPMCVREKI